MVRADQRRRQRLAIGIVVHRHLRIDHDDEVGLARQRDVGVRHLADGAVDVVASVVAHGLEEERDRRRGADRLGDGDVDERALPEDGAVARVEIVGGDVQLARHLGEARRQRVVAQEALEEALVVAQGEDAGRQRVAEVGDELAEIEVAAHGARRRREEHAADVAQDAEALAQVEAVDVAAAGREEVRIVVERGAEQAARADARRQDGREEGAGRGADVDVEVVDAEAAAAVASVAALGAREEVVERGERADLVHAAHDPAAAKTQRGTHHSIVSWLR